MQLIELVIFPSNVILIHEAYCREKLKIQNLLATCKQVFFYKICYFMNWYELVYNRFRRLCIDISSTLRSNCLLVDNAR
jgi:hypothetical protein